MPTGYTCYIEEGEITTGKEFLKLCTRAFGIAMGIKEEPLSTPTPLEFSPSDYCAKRVTNAKQNVEYWENISFDEARKILVKNQRDDILSSRRLLARYIETNEKYNKVRKEVLSWTPPTAEHSGIQKFALEQIDMCIITEDVLNRLRESAEKLVNIEDEDVYAFIATRLQYAREDYERAKESYDKEIQDAKEKTKFMNDFIKSLETLPVN